MKDTLRPGITYQHRFIVPRSKTVPALYPESAEFALMPEVVATGFLGGFLERTCVRALVTHLDWPDEQTVGTHIDISHQAATSVGLEVLAKIALMQVDDRRLVFEVEASDGIDIIARGGHERFMIDKAKFDAKIVRKRSKP